MNYNAQERIQIRAELKTFLERAKSQPRLRGWTKVYGPLILALLEDIDELSRQLAIEKLESKEHEKRATNVITGLRAKIHEERRLNGTAGELIKQQRETIRVLRERLDKQAQYHAAWKKEYAKVRAEVDEARGQSETAFVFVVFDIDGPHLSGKHGG